MADVFTIDARGLRALDGRITRASTTLTQQRDAMLTRLAQQAAARLKDAAPRGKTSTGGGHMADLFRPAPITVTATGATISVTNSKQVTGGGKTYFLADLIASGTQPHNIPGAFGYKPPFGVGGRFSGLFHPGSAPNDFIRRAMEGFDPSREGQKAAVKVIGTIVGTGTEDA